MSACAIPSSHPSIEERSCDRGRFVQAERIPSSQVVGMRSIVLRPLRGFVALALLLACSPFRPGRAEPPTDEVVLRQMKEDLWPRAYREGDPALLDRILAKEFQMIDPDGGWSNKQKELEYVAKNKAQNKSFRFEIRRLEVFENGTAVIAGRGIVIGPKSDPEGGYQYESSNILIKRDGRWQAIASHVSGVRPLTAAEKPKPKR